MKFNPTIEILDENDEKNGKNGLNEFKETWEKKKNRTKGIYIN